LQSASAKVNDRKKGNHEKQPALSDNEDDSESDGDVMCDDRESEVHVIESDALDELNEKSPIAELLSALQSLQRSVVFMNRKYDKIYDKLKAIEKLNVKVVEENKQLKSQAASLELELDKAEQYSRRENIKIKNVFFEKDTNTEAIVSQ